MLWLLICVMTAYGLVGALLYLFRQTVMAERFYWPEFLEAVVAWPKYVVENGGTA